jgi:hypothetical protein
LRLPTRCTHHRSARPTSAHAAACAPPTDAASVDISIKLTTLAKLDNDPGLIAGWEPVIADIARQVALNEHTMPSWRWSVTDENGLVLHHGHTQRRPTAAEAAFTRARDQVCATPGCRRPANQCDLDHRRANTTCHGPSGPRQPGPALRTRPPPPHQPPQLQVAITSKASTTKKPVKVNTDRPQRPPSTSPDPKTDSILTANL